MENSNRFAKRLAGTLLLVVVMAFLSCSPSVPNPVNVNEPTPVEVNEPTPVEVSEPQAKEAPQPIELFGQIWEYHAPYAVRDPLLPPSGSEYRNDESHRLIGLTGDGVDPWSIVFIAWTEKREGDKWIKDGTQIAKFHDGMKRYTEYKNGLMHGTYRQWAPNGQLVAEYEYANDELHGRYRRWTADGELECDIEHEHGVEVKVNYPKKDDN